MCRPDGRHVFLKGKVQMITYLRRIENIAKLRGELAAWEVERNTVAAKVNWQFRTADARVKLSSLYPRFTTASE